MSVFENKFLNATPHFVRPAQMIWDDAEVIYSDDHIIKKRSNENESQAAVQKSENEVPIIENLIDDQTPLIEIAVFLDEPFYNKFNAAFPNKTIEIQDLVIIYMNGVQSIFHHPTLGIKIDIVVTEMYKLTKNFELKHNENVTGQVRNVINPFCHFQRIRNFPNDTHPKYWDIALLLTGLKVIDREEKLILGHAVGDICTRGACVTVRVGGMNMAHAISHEIGHV